MNVQEYLKHLPVLFKANVTPWVWGLHGIGKTTVPQQFCDDNGHKLFNLRLGNMELGDLLGLADFEEDADGVKISTKFMKPDWLKDLIDFAVNNPDKYAVIHLDEINRVRKDMMNPVFQIALEGRLHTTVFPPNVRVIASANPAIDGYWVNDVSELALTDRFCHLAYRPEVSEWINYANAKGVHPDMVAFITDQPQQLHSVQVIFDIDQYCRPTNRSTEMAARLYSQGADRELIGGCLGAVTTNAFYIFLEENKSVVINPEDILAYNKKTQKAVKELVKSGKLAHIKTVCDTFSSSIKAAGDTETPREYTLDEGAAVCAFLSDIPMDVAWGACLQLIYCTELHRMMSYDPEAPHKGKGYERQDKFFDKLKAALDSGLIDRAAVDSEQKSA